MHLVYGLHDGRMRYIGRTSQPRKRLKSHRKHPSRAFLRFVVLAICRSEAESMEAEASLIDWFRRLGHPLENILDGGPGEFARHVAAHPWMGKRRRRRPATGPVQDPAMATRAMLKRLARRRDVKPDNTPPPAPAKGTAEWRRAEAARMNAIRSAPWSDPAEANGRPVRSLLR